MTDRNSTILEIRIIIQDIRTAMSVNDWDRVDFLAANLESHASLIGQSVSSMAYNNLRNAMIHRDIINIKINLMKIDNIIRFVRNDFPFSLNDVIGIIRSDRGIFDGNTSATISEKNQVNGVWQYKAIDFDGNEHIINNTRNAFKIIKLKNSV